MQKIEEWPTETEAAEMLGTSVKTITRYASQGKIEVRKRPVAGRKPENVCNPTDVQRLMPTAHVMPHEPEAAALAPASPRGNRNATELLAFIRTIATAIETERQTVQMMPKLWLSLAEAAAYSGLSRADLYRLAQEGKLLARKSPGWKIQRASLEAFEG